MSEQDERLSGPDAGLGATGRTADDFDPGDAPAGGDYGDPSGIARAVTDEDAAGDNDDDRPA
jgi:hypothetical protein